MIHLREGVAESFVNEESRYNDACFRASRTAGIFNYLLEQKALDPTNLSGKVVDLGTGNGGGVLAAKVFGAQEVIGVDDGLGLGSGLGVEEARPSEEIFGLSGVQHCFERVQVFMSRQLPESIDLVTAFRIPPFRFPSPFALCRMAYPLLKPGGQIIMTEGDLVPVWERMALSIKNNRRPIEIALDDENGRFWDVKQYRGRLFFLPSMRAAVKSEIKKGELVFPQDESLNICDDEVFIGTKI